MVNHIIRLILVTISILDIFFQSYVSLKTLKNASPTVVDQKFGNMTLLITAHPDDETMFFGPTILNLLETKRHLIILCLSVGDSDNLGFQRRQEFFDVIDSLGPYVTSALIDNKDLKDGNNWDTRIVSAQVESFVRSRNFPIQTIVTFDSIGVSGHTNHKSIYEATKLLKVTLADLNIKYFYLNSVELWRKYISFLDAVLSGLVSLIYYEEKSGDSIVLAINFSQYASLRQILLLHRSQMVWFRQLYMIFSRYMFINDLTSY